MPLPAKVAGSKLFWAPADVKVAGLNLFKDPGDANVDPEAKLAGLKLFCDPKDPADAPKAAGLNWPDETPKFPCCNELVDNPEGLPSC